MDSIIEILKAKHISLIEEPMIFDSIAVGSKRKIEYQDAGYPTITDEFWTAKQR
ncbi:MAG: hypothetical protein Q8J62_01560 [Candidatus Cloacimonadaceae bacterium]|nr:hypothetical protein [Candidatus Cloacimonadaceae bacterium]